MYQSCHWAFVALALLGVGAPGEAADSMATASALRVEGGTPGFTRVGPGTSGVVFTNHLARHRHLTNQVLLNGSGVAAGDVNGDKLVDLYFCRLDGPNALYLNLGGWQFREQAEQAGVSCPDIDATGAVFADVDGDGDLDLLVNSLGGGTRLFFNNGRGIFTAASEILNRDGAGTSMSLADLDGNGTLDLYVANYRSVTLRDQPNTAFRLRMTDGKPEVATINGRPLTDPELTNRFTFQIKVQNGRVSFVSDEHGEADALFFNDGRGRFSPRPFTSGTFRDENGAILDKPLFDWGLSVMLRDLNGDRFPDIYVCNDFKSPDRIWINDGQGTFNALPRAAIRQTSLSSMGVDVADINRDGHADIFVVDMLSREHSRRLSQRPDVNPEIAPPGDTTTRVQSARNTFLLARGDGTFAEAAHFAGLEAAEWAWTPAFLDVDLDGLEDILVSNGFERDGMNVDVLREIEARKASRRMSTVEQLGLRDLFPRLDTPNAAFRNLGGARFADVSEQWRFNARDVSQGMCLADLDGDGDLDVAVNIMNGAAALYRNDTAAPRIAVRLEGHAPNTRGIGAHITVSGGPVTQWQEMICGGRYLSSDDFMRVFAAGSKTNPLRIEVRWRSGRTTVVDAARPNHLYVVREGDSAPEPLQKKITRPPLFADVSDRLRHRHVDEPFDDFASQPLLTQRLSHDGPGVAWFDINDDGWDDLILPGGKGGSFEILVNGPDGFRPESRQTIRSLLQDQMAVLGWHSPSGSMLLVASSNYENRAGGDSVARAFGLSNNVGRVVATLRDGMGPMSMADIDRDGDLDLFTGGRSVPGQFPRPASSLLWRSENGIFNVDTTNRQILAGAGLVRGSLFSDFDGDGDPDLILACEWGAIRVLQNDRGRFRDVTAGAGLANHRGWWNGVAAGDFNEDGWIDIVASNRGENTRFQRHLARPLRIYFNDFEGDGVVEMLEAHYEPSLRDYAPSCHLGAALAGMPWLRARFPSWSSFSTATVAAAFGNRMDSMSAIEAGWPASTLFLNRGGRFEAVRLPDAAQMSPACGICVADFDGDAHDDIFLAQNFFGVTGETSRYDAGRGLLLKGNGQGGFLPDHTGGSGIAIDGEQRGAAAADFDRDGRMDLVVMQNAAETKLFRNVLARPGLRLRLRGSAANPDAIGAVVRVGNGARPGAAREVHAGSGYLSQDSNVLVLPRQNDRLLVRWPAGHSTTSAIPSSAMEIEVDANGVVSTVR
jgi:hypothetical protein